MSDEAYAEVARAVALAEFTLYQRRILTVLLEASFGAGKPEAYIPRLAYFARAAGMSEGNVSSTLKQLKRCQVIEELPKDVYGFRLPTENWKVPPQIDLTVLREILDLRFAQPDNLNAALREALPEKGASTPHPQSLSPVEAERGSVLPTRVGTGQAAGFGVRPIQPDAPEHVPGRLMGGVASRESAGLSAAGEAVVVAGPGTTASPLSPAGSGFRKPGDGTEGSGKRKVESSPVPARGLPVVPDSGSPFKSFNSFSSSKLSTAELLKPGQRELLSQVRAVVGERTWQNWGGAWTNLVKRDVDLVRRVVATFHADSLERKISNPGGWMWDLAKRWQG